MGVVKWCGDPIFHGCGAFHCILQYASLSQSYYIDSIQFRDRYIIPRVAEYVCYLLVVYKSYS